VEAIDRVLTAHRVDGLLSVAWEKPVEQTTRYVGRGRGSLHREKRVIQNTRYHITHITRQKTSSLLATNVLVGKPLPPMRGTRGCLCRMRCCAIAMNTA